MAATATRTGLFCVQCRHIECAAQNSENMICRFCEDGVPCPIAQRETKAGSSKAKNVATELPQHARSNGNGRSNSVAPSPIPAVRAKADGVSPHKRPCATLGCPNTCRVRNKYPYCTPCQQAGKHTNEAPAVLRQRLETANRGQLKELPPRLKHAKPNGRANGNGHRKNGNSEQFATLVVSEAHLDRFLTLLPIDRKAALVTEEVSPGGVLTMATNLQSWPPPEPPKPPMPISTAQESVLTGTEQAVALVRFIAALPFDERTYHVSRYDEDRCSFCHTDIERGNASECHFDDCVWDAARRTVQKLRLEGVPW